MGCLSPRRMYEELRAQTQKHTQKHPRLGAAPFASHLGEGGQCADAGTNWLVFELLWRDFFRFVTKKYAQDAPKLSPMPAAVA
jgi:deoxyribodipyrimidine photolyase